MVWFLIIEQVSDLTKLNWLQVYDIPAVEFLTYATIAKTKINKRNMEIKKMQMKFAK